MTVADPVPLGEEHSLGAYEWAKVDKDVPTARGCGCLLLAVSVVMVPTAVLPFVEGRPVDIRFGAIWAPLIGCLLVTAALLVWRFPPRRVVRTFSYSGGLIQLTPEEPEPCVMRWDRVVSLTVRITRSDDSDDRIGSSTVCDSSGTCLTTGGDALARKAAQVLTPRVVPPLMRAFDAGETVRFGSTRIDRSGITGAGITDTREPVFIAWPDMRRISFDARVRFGIQLADRRKRVQFDLEDAPNGFFAHYVIEHAAGMAGVPVKFVEDRRLPPRLPVAAGQ